MKTLASMSPAQMSTYLNMLAKATEGVVPPDGHFFLIVFAEDGMAHWTGNVERADMPAALREAADRIEAEADSRN